ncbi:MAG: hypothetical protein KF807_10495 [Xanthobacteraceae bacterium]|nr:hypothetical protein [Xanthobacteraceae bacterium]
MASVESRNIVAEEARLEAIARGAGAALACMHETAEDLHRALVSEYLQRKQGQGFWSRMRALSIFSF